MHEVLWHVAGVALAIGLTLLVAWVAWVSQSLHELRAEVKRLKTRRCDNDNQDYDDADWWKNN